MNEEIKNRMLDLQVAILEDGYEDFLIMIVKEDGNSISMQVAGHGCPMCMVDRVNKWAIEKDIQHNLGSPMIQH